MPYVGSGQTGAGSGLDAMGYVVLAPSAAIDLPAHLSCLFSGQHNVYNTMNSFAHFHYPTAAPFGQVRLDATIAAQGANTPLPTQVTPSHPVDPTLSVALSHFPIPWDVRARDPTSFAFEPLLDAFAFEDSAKSCLLYFALPKTNEFRTERRIALQEPIRVRDIINAINDVLFEPRPPLYIPNDHPAFPGAIAARQYRTAPNRRGPDPPQIVWRRVDAWPGQALSFRGLQRVHPTERKFVVLLEPAVPQ